MGRCGSQDVADVMQAVDYVTGTLKKGDPTKLYVCGGSHGTSFLFPSPSLRPTLHTHTRTRKHASTHAR
jgi:hypothetical protein